jgi:hypothetical protein
MSLVYGLHGREYGDGRVYQQLAGLPERFVVYAQPALHSPSGSRYPDYVILDRKRGLIVLEVKDWKHVRPAKDHRAKVLQTQSWQRLMMTNPVEQARQASIVLRKAFQQDQALIHHRGPYRGKIVLPVGYAGYLPNLEDERIQQLRRCWGYGSLFGKKELISTPSLLRSLDRYPYPFRMNLEDKDTVFTHIHQILFPKILFWDEDDPPGSFWGRTGLVGI